MDEIHVESFFNKEERELLESVIKQIDDSKVEKNLGRSFYHLEDFPIELENKLTSYVKQQTGKNVKLTGRAFSTYSNEYGEPNLPPHLDRNDTSYILDYQYEANTVWPVTVEKKEYILNNNDGLLLAGKTHVHWRPKKKFLDGEFVSMIFFHFLNIDEKKVNEEFTEEEMKIHNEKMKNEYSFYWENDIDN